MNHFSGIVPDERYKNEMLQIQREILNELRMIREALSRDAQTAKPEPMKRTYKKRGA